MNEKECTAPDELFSMTTSPEMLSLEILLKVPDDGLPCQQPGRSWIIGEWCELEDCPFAVNRWPWD